MKNLKINKIPTKIYKWSIIYFIYQSMGSCSFPTVKLNRERSKAITEIQSEKFNFFVKGFCLLNT